ncbi:MAG: acyltransferase [Hyphomicrobiales bacterium]|uniref:acyltransferase family protein n=1 Tax=Nisaea sp. TaxID=2024842 RepID=UPI00326D59ED
MTAATVNSGKFENLQALRAFAALSVVLLHGLEIAGSYGQTPQILGLFGKWGNCGVDLFFVISGFVMIYVHSIRPRSPFAFLTARISRIVPIYWFITLSLAIVSLVLPSAFRTLEIDAAHLTSSLFFFASATSDLEPVLEAGWTLEYEMLFYALFAVALTFRNELVLYLLPIVVLGALAISGLADWIVLEFIIGMGLAKFFVNGGKISHPLLVLIAGAAFLFASIPFAAEAEHVRVLVWGIPSALIVLSALYLPQLKNPLVTLLGNASYSIYLVHFVALTIIYKIIAMSGLGTRINADVLLVFTLLAATVGGVVFYALIETPIGSAIKRQSLFSPQLVARLGSSFVSRFNQVQHHR